VSRDEFEANKKPAKAGPDVLPKGVPVRVVIVFELVVVCVLNKQVLRQLSKSSQKQRLSRIHTADWQWTCKTA
jgi:hypothetical protein